jgi:hypothetical protein
LVGIANSVGARRGARDDVADVAGLVGLVGLVELVALVADVRADVSRVRSMLARRSARRLVSATHHR